jgi:hypothetical protein
MSNEPERPIEKALRACAQRRRTDAGAPMELHPATRRLLQGEVARQFARERRKAPAWSERLARLWPRFAWGLVVLVGLVSALSVIIPARNKAKERFTLAKNAEGLNTPANALGQPPQVAAGAQPAVEGAKLSPEPSPEPPGAIATRAPTSPGEKSAFTASTTPAPTLLADGRRMKEAMPRKAPVGEIASTPATPSDNDVALPHRYGLARAESSLADRSASAAQPLVPDELLKQSNEPAAGGQLAYKSVPAPAAAAAPALDAPTKDAFSGALAYDLRKGKASDAPVIQRFYRLGLPSDTTTGFDKALTMKGVLASFRVEQSGREVRIVDSDGSVYAGSFQLAQAMSQPEQAEAKKTPVARTLGAADGKLEQNKLQVPEARSESVRRQAQAPGTAGAALEQDREALKNFSFRVFGTNRSLRQPVVFSGSFLGDTNLVFFSQSINRLGTAVGGTALQPKPAEPAPQPQLNLRISGSVKIGDGKEFEINALAVPP